MSAQQMWHNSDALRQSQKHEWSCKFVFSTAQEDTMPTKHTSSWLSWLAKWRHAMFPWVCKANHPQRWWVNWWRKSQTTKLSLFAVQHKVGVLFKCAGPCIVIESFTTISSFLCFFLLKTNLNKMTVRADWSRPMMSGQHNVLHDQAKQDIVQPGLKQLRNSPLQPNWQDVLQTWPVSIVFCNIWIVHLSLVNAHIDVLLIKSICFRPKRAAWLRPCQLSAFWRDGCTNNFSFSFKFISIVFFPHWTSRWFERRLQTHCLMSMRVWVLHSSDN